MIRSGGSTQFLLSLAVGALLVVACTPETGRPGGSTARPTPTTGNTAGLPSGIPPEGLGVEPGLNGLALDCYGGVLQACDDLVLASPPGSKYERYGATCGGRNEAVGSCVRLYAPRFSENTATKIGLASGSPTGLIAGIRLAGHDSFDRFVLEFEPGGLPGYEVGYIKEQILPVLGDRIPLEGIILLSIAVSPAISQRDLPVRVRGDTTNVVEVALIEQGDDGVKFAAALNQQTGFEVMTLDDPPRLVVDVSHR